MAKTPSHLKAEGKAFFEKIVADFDISDAAGLALLTRASECIDRMAAAREIIKKEGEICTDRYGSPKLHPAVVLEKDSRSGFLQAVKALNLDLEPLNPAPGRPAGR